MYLPIKKHLTESVGCDSVYGEILKYDILALKGNFNIIVEMKTILNFKLLEQALYALEHGDYVYIATPKRKRRIGQFDPSWFVYSEFLKKYGIGWLEVDFDESWRYPHVKELYKARCNRTAKKLRIQTGRDNIRKYIKDYSHLNIGGVPGGEKVTDYSRTIHNIKTYLRRERVYGSNDREGWRSVREILDECKTHYVNPYPSVIQTLQKSWNSDWCENRRVKNEKQFRFKEDKQN